MHSILSIIATLSSEDKKKFVSGLKQRNKRNDTKNIELFELLNTSTPRKDLELLLYGKRATGAYHALCKRLYDSLIDYIASKNIEQASSKEMDALKLVLVSRTLFEHQQIPIAVKTLAKAAIIAKNNSLHNTLNEIYQLQLSHAHLHDSLNFQEVLLKFQQNKKNLVQEENLNLFYAAVQNELSNKNPILSDVIERNLKLYDISITKNMSYQSLYKILQISNQVANVTRNYYEILDFIEKGRKQILASKRTQNEHLYFHIQILYYLSNTYFRIKYFRKSAEYLSRMWDHINFQNQKYFRVFYCQYLLLENLLLIYTGQLEPVIQKLQNFDFQPYKNQEEHVHDLKLTLIVALFLNEQFHDALKKYRDFYHSDIWYAKKVGFIWVIKKNLLEILLLIELDYIDLVESRLKSFRKKHSHHLIEHKEERILDFVNLIHQYFNDKVVVDSPSFEAKLVALLKKDNEEDIFTLSFYAWLKAKTRSLKTYDTCLAHISSNDA